MTLKVRKVCHLGSTCEEVIDGDIVRCMQYIQIQGTDAQGKAQDRWDCSFAWVPILMLEQSRHNLHNTAAIDKMCNTVTAKREILIDMIQEKSLGIGQEPGHLLDK